MRENIAKLVAGLTVAVVVGLSLLFAIRHNPGAAASAPTRPEIAPGPAAKVPDGGALRPESPKDVAPVAAPPPELVARGRAVYEQQNCAVCHSISGEGNPRAPLDDVGARHSAAELQAWITGSGVAAEVLAPAIVRRKQRYLSMPASDMDALIGFLATLKTGK